LFHLPRTRLHVTTSRAPGASRWLANGEEVLDVEMSHAVAPAAAIHVILFDATAVSTAAGLDRGHDRHGAVRHCPR
jgi:subtilase family serine protease